MSRATRRASVAAWAGTVVLLAAGCGAGRSDAGAVADPEVAALRAAAAQQPCPSGAGAALPDLTLPCLSGGPAVDLRAAGPGRPMLVNVWATWCAPCVREVPELVALARDGAGKVDLLGVLTEDTEGNGLEFARQFAMRYPSVVDTEGVVMRAFSPGPPVTLFLDATGQLRYVQRGEIKDSQTLRALVRDHLGVDVAPAVGPAPGAATPGAPP